MTHVIAFTGHRPQDLPADFGYEKFAAALDALGMHKRAHDVKFIVGGALGTDTWAATYAITRGIEFDLYMPFTAEVMGKFWSEHDRVVLQTSVLAADHVTVLKKDGYDVAEYQRRNIAMVDAADYVFALWSGKRNGGTWNCLKYAQKVDKTAYNLFPLDGKLHAVKGI